MRHFPAVSYSVIFQSRCRSRTFFPVENEDGAIVEAPAPLARTHTSTRWGLNRDAVWTWEFTARPHGSPGLFPIRDIKSPSAFRHACDRCVNKLPPNTAASDVAGAAFLPILWGPGRAGRRAVDSSAVATRAWRPTLGLRTAVHTLSLSVPLSLALFLSLSLSLSLAGAPGPLRVAVCASSLLGGLDNRDLVAAALSWGLSQDRLIVTSAPCGGLRAPRVGGHHAFWWESHGIAASGALWRPLSWSPCLAGPASGCPPPPGAACDPVTPQTCMSPSTPTNGQVGSCGRECSPLGCWPRAGSPPAGLAAVCC
uniref:uncharacterized protein LOC118527954 n=1 Tax=Halichoerus grypus TaxID=9711 RepID=UPI0016596145|nr:uncharacterized protein LOC118527954 [Halichoerus grypus]